MEIKKETTEKLGKNSALLFVLLLFAVSSYLTINLAPGFDEHTHSLDAMFYERFLQHPQFSGAIDAAYDFYARYPLLHIMYYPPLYELGAGAMMLLLGESVQAAKITTILFALATLCVFFELVRYLYGRQKALVGVALLAFSPMFFSYGSSAMLEVPVLFFFMLSSYFFLRAVKEDGSGRNKWLYLFGISMGLGLVTRWSIVLLVPVFFVYLVYASKWRLMLKKEFIAAAVLAALICAPYFFLMWKQGILSYLIDYSAGCAQCGPSLLSPSRWAFYPISLFSQLSIPLAVFSVFALAYFAWKRAEREMFFVIYVLVTYVLVSRISLQDIRYAIYYSPAFVCLALALLDKIKLGRAWKAALIALLLIGEMATIAIALPPYADQNIAAASKFINLNLDRNEAVLPLSNLDAYMFYIAREDKGVKDIVVKSSVQYVFDNMTCADYASFLAQDHVRLVVVDETDNSPLYSKLDGCTRSSNFTEIARFGEFTIYDTGIRTAPGQPATICVPALITGKDVTCRTVE